MLDKGLKKTVNNNKKMSSTITLLLLISITKKRWKISDSKKVFKKMLKMLTKNLFLSANRTYKVLEEGTICLQIHSQKQF